MKRYLILVAAIVMQMCLGATYAWSVFVQPIKETTGILQGTAQLPFSLFYFAFPATMIVTGTLLPRIGPRRCAMTGGLLFGGGWLLAALGGYHFLFTAMGIGLVAGVGVGFAYIVPIATCVRWFPRQKGLVTGVAVAGFGGGAALVGKVAGGLMNGHSVDPFTTFALLGTAFLVLVTGAGAVMANPPRTAASTVARMPIATLLRTRTFVFLYLAMFSGLAAGFAVNANLKELYGNAGIRAGVTAVAAFALANAAGRIAWGWLFDRFRSLRILQANLMVQATLLALNPLLLKSESGLIAFSTLAGFNYGGILVLYASATAETWGSERLSQIYGWLFSANMPAAVSPIVAGLVFDRWGSFAPALGSLSLVMIVAALTLGLDRTPKPSEAASI